MQYAKKLDQIEVRFEDLSEQLADPAIISDGDRYRKTAKARADLEEIVNKYRAWKRVAGDLEQARGMLTETDPELKQMAADETLHLEPEKERIEQDLKVLLLAQGSERRQERRT